MKKILYSFALIALTLVACKKDTDETSIEILPIQENEISSRSSLLAEINKLRVEGCTCGSTDMPRVDSLQWNETIEKAALLHSNDMAKKSFTSHTGSDGSDTGSRLSRVGYNFSSWGENIASGISTKEGALNGWKNSEPHCKNMMNANFTEIAVAKKGTYWTMVLGKPQS